MARLYVESNVRVPLGVLTPPDGTPVAEVSRIMGYAHVRAFRAVGLMAAYRCSVQIVSRSTGRSAVAAAAYRAGAELRDARYGVVHDYTRKHDVAHSEIMLPPAANDEYQTRETLWNAVEAAERRKDAQLAREVEVMLPRELSDTDNLALVRSYAQEQFVARGMIADIAVHNGHVASDGGAQPHAHIMLTMRELGPEGFGKKVREWNGTDQLESWRSAWADHANRALEKAGVEERIDHRSLAAQRDAALERGDTDKAAELDREPLGKVPGSAWQMEQRGLATEAGERQRGVKTRNAQQKALGQQLRDVRDQITARLKELGISAQDRISQLRGKLDWVLGRGDRGADRPRGRERDDIDRDGHDGGMAGLGKRDTPVSPAAQRLRDAVKQIHITRMTEQIHERDKVHDRDKDQSKDRAKDRERGGPER